MSNQKELNKIYGEVNFMITNASKKELFDYIVGLEIQNKKYKEVIDKAIEYINLIVLGETFNGEPVLFKEEAEGQYLLSILKGVE